jgi:hypothetical protein
MLCCSCLRAATIVSVKATVVNTGNVRLRNLAWTTSWVSAVSAWSGCLLGMAGFETTAPTSTTEVPVNEQLICAGTFAINQTVMEEGLSKAMTSSVSVKATDSLVALALQQGTVSIPINVNPNMTVDVLDNDCLKPYRAGTPAETTCFLVNRCGSQHWAAAASIQHQHP